MHHYVKILGMTIFDRRGDQIGTIYGIVYDQSGEPRWALVNTGLFGTKLTFVPIAEAKEISGVQVRYEKQLVIAATNIDLDDVLSESEKQELRRHYGLEYAEEAAGLDEDRVTEERQGREDVRKGTGRGPGRRGD